MGERFFKGDINNLVLFPWDKLQFKVPLDG